MFNELEFGKFVKDMSAIAQAMSKFDRMYARTEKVKVQYEEKLAVYQYGKNLRKMYFKQYDYFTDVNNFSDKMEYLRLSL